MFGDAEGSHRIMLEMAALLLSLVPMAPQVYAAYISKSRFMRAQSRYDNNRVTLICAISKTYVRAALWEKKKNSRKCRMRVA